MEKNNEILIQIINHQSEYLCINLKKNVLYQNAS